MPDISQNAASVRLLAIDVDGTLIGAEHSISPRVLQALKEMQARGVRIALSTRRPVHMPQGLYCNLTPIRVKTFRPNHGLGDESPPYQD
jgi:ribonucleotide monophosphatase NagD (HAD superfamily)